MPQSSSKAEWLAREIQLQKIWIQEHGGDLAGYVARYGSKDAEHFGDGGEAIFAADARQLAKLESQLASFGGHAVTAVAPLRYVVKVEDHFVSVSKNTPAELRSPDERDQTAASCQNREEAVHYAQGVVDGLLMAGVPRDSVALVGV